MFNTSIIGRLALLALLTSACVNMPQSRLDSEGPSSGKVVDGRYYPLNPSHFRSGDYGSPGSVGYAGAMGHSSGALNPQVRRAIPPSDPIHNFSPVAEDTLQRDAHSSVNSHLEVPYDPKARYTKDYVQQAQKLFSPNSGCPAAAKMASRIGGSSKGYGCSQYDTAMLRAIASIKPGGGNYQRGGGMHWNIDLPLGNGQGMPSKKSGSSGCSTGTESAFLLMLYQSNPKILDSLSPYQRASFFSGRDNADKISEKNQGFWERWNGSGQSAYTANRYVGFGENIPRNLANDTNVNDTLSKACPGDLLHFDRVKGAVGKGYSGHSTVFLGVEGGKVYYWSSNLATNGYGVQCEAIHGHIEHAHITRVTQPEKIAGMAPYPGKADPHFIAEGLQKNRLIADTSVYSH